MSRHEIETELDRTRDDLDETLDALTARLDVKQRLHDSADDPGVRAVGIVAAAGLLALVGFIAWRHRH